MTHYHPFPVATPTTTTTSTLDPFASSTDTWAPAQESLQHGLQSLIENAKQPWTYAIFWQPTSSVLGWADGYYKGDDKQKKSQPISAASAAEQQHRKEVLRSLNSLISGAEASSSDDNGDEEVTDTEWFFLISMTQSFGSGSGLPGRAFQTNSFVWVSGGDRLMSCQCDRAAQAQNFGLQTLVCVPVGNGVVELGSTDLIFRSSGLLNQVNILFDSNGGQSGDWPLGLECDPSEGFVREVDLSKSKSVVVENHSSSTLTENFNPSFSSASHVQSQQFDRNQVGSNGFQDMYNVNPNVGGGYLSDQVNGPYGGMMMSDVMMNSDGMFVGESSKNAVVQVQPQMSTVQTEYCDKHTRDFLGMGNLMDSLPGTGMENDGFGYGTGTATNSPDSEATISAEAGPFVPGHPAF